ncbi:UdgX family uracil-DNA binding protein [Pararhizobium haloflavum]|uniref:UdgX family uracil-DNA binding protein n=1 Tax=Pararhizobium haloflavum TaxID=2037914 RepID=UPI000C19B27C|nr:UdgX family uracil-DNA binding protein [Pararhizobium haloflavum]
MFTVELADQTDFDGWRHSARALALAGIEPAQVRWTVKGAQSDDLFDAAASALPEPRDNADLTVPRPFIERLQTIMHHSDDDRFAFMYRLLLRVSQEADLLKVLSDLDVQRLERMEKAIRRDAHKMHAFVRFRKVAVGGKDRFVAWFEPDHYIAEREADFFVKRFAGMNWTIMTPWRTIDWDGERLTIAPGARKEDAPSADAAEDLWRTYFSSIFNPARLKVKAMQAEMPKKYWRNLPEAPLIPALIASAGRRAENMVESAPTSAAPHHSRIQQRYWEGRQTMTEITDASSLDDLRKMADGCTRCPLYRDATQTVFGEGPENAEIIFVGEQPGDQEDLAGAPFVGPAGKVFDDTLAQVGIDRQRVYVTNAVKHFKFVPRGKRRLHQKPNGGEVQACRWWLDREIALIKPKLVVALGATALTALYGKTLPVTKNRRQVLRNDADLKIFVTVHPSFLLRIPDAETAARERRLFAEDLAALRDLMAA